MRPGESNYRFTPFVEHRGAFKLNGTTGDSQPARRIKAPKVADSSSSRACSEGPAFSYPRM